MTTTEIILTILGSSLLSTLAASLFSWKLHKSTYKQDYYSKILDLRLEIYHLINSLTSNLSTFVQTEKGVVNVHLSHPNTFHSFSNLLSRCIDKSNWASQETGLLLTELSAFLINNFSNEINDDWPTERLEQEYLRKADEHYEALNNFKKELKRLYNKDLKSLYKIEEFLNEGESEKSFPIYDRKKF